MVPPTATAIVNVTVLDGRGGPARPNSAVLLAGDRISAVLQRDEALPASTPQIDGGGFLLPGFIDMHAHLLVPRRDGSFDREVSVKMVGTLLDFIRAERKQH